MRQRQRGMLLGWIGLSTLALGGCGEPTPTPPAERGAMHTGAAIPLPATMPATPMAEPRPAGSTPEAAAAAGAQADPYADVPQKAEEIRPLLTGSALPEITLLDAEKREFDLAAAVKTQPTLLIFFRGGWCPYCNRHLQALQQIEPELVKLGYQIIAVSADKPELLPVDMEKNGLKYRLYSDSSMAAARALGICFKVDPATVEKYKGYKIDLEDASGYSHHLLPVPAAYVLRTDGSIADEYINPNYRVRADTEVLMAACKAALKPPLGPPGKGK